MRENYEIGVRWIAFPLHPNTPPEGLTLEELFAGRSMDIDQMMERLRRVALEEGLPLGERKKTYNSRLAQELGKWAEAQGQGDRFHRAAFRAYFVDGKNIAEIPILVDLYRSGTTSDRLAAVSAIGSLGCATQHAEAVLPVLLGALQDASCGVRLSAIYALSRMQSEAWAIAPALRDILYDPNPTVRRHAAAALAALNSTGPQE